LFAGCDAGATGAGGGTRRGGGDAPEGFFFGGDETNEFIWPSVARLGEGAGRSRGWGFRDCRGDVS
jgi:hypothetical protein